MKITQRHDDAKYFRELEKGTVFKLLTGDRVYMKTERIETGDFACNVVDLINGRLEMASEVALVIPLEHELIIN